MIINYDRLEWLQYNLNLDLMKTIFGEDLYEHLYWKWTRCDDNIIDFITLLDIENKQKLFDFVNLNT